MWMRTFVIGLGISVCLVTAFLGCATTSPEPEDTVPVGYTYSPTLPPGIESVEAARKDLSGLLSGPKCPGVRYYGEPGINDYARKDALTELVKGKSGPISFWYGHEGLVFMAFESLTVLDDEIKVCPRIAFPFDDLIACSIVVEKTEERPGAGHHIVGSHVGSFVRPYKVDFPGRMAFLFTDRSDAQRFADDLFFIQQTLKKAHDERRARLESRAAEYRSMAVKPPVSEEQRKYIVQANALNERKDYTGAVELYLKAVDVDPVAYPGAYFNLALLSAQMKRYNTAIDYMKQYLLLEPDAPDTRSAQDKIYEWELLAKR